MMFEVKGSFRIGERFQSFNIRVKAKNKQLALEQVFSLLGSNHKCKRRFIKVDGVEIVR